MSDEDKTGGHVWAVALMCLAAWGGTAATVIVALWVTASGWCLLAMFIPALIKITVWPSSGVNPVAQKRRREKGGAVDVHEPTA